jgi:hypothetical protein
LLLKLEPLLLCFSHMLVVCVVVVIIVEKIDL